MKFKLSKPLGEILQPLVDKVPKFWSSNDVTQWIKEHFPCGSKSAAAIASLSKWVQSEKTERHSNGRRQGWSLGAGMGQCALCVEFNWACSNKCPLIKHDGCCDNGDNSFYHLATQDGDKQPLIEALELASVHALVDELRQKCEETVREIVK